MVPDGRVRGEKSRGLFLFWETCVSVQPARGLILPLSQLGGLYRAEESIMATGINGIISEEREEGRGKGRTGGLCFQMKLSLGAVLSDGARR